MLDVCEIFGITIQGEGKRVGKPSVFIRFSKCNFTCAGFNVAYVNDKGENKLSCDTYYAIDKSFKNTWLSLSANDIIQKVLELCENKKVDIVISGGEPLLNWKKDEFQEILEYFSKNNHHITIETNASIDIDFTKEYQRNIMFSMSVKLYNSLEKYQKRVKPELINKIISSTKESYLKFVVNKNTLNETETEIKDILLLLNNPEVYLMPMGDTLEILKKNEKEVISLCIKNNYNYSDRLHIRLWDDKRGV